VNWKKRVYEQKLGLKVNAIMGDTSLTQASVDSWTMNEQSFGSGKLTKTKALKHMYASIKPLNKTMKSTLLQLKKESPPRKVKFRGEKNSSFFGEIIHQIRDTHQQIPRKPLQNPCERKREEERQ
jgi:hypothetical protein